MVCYASNVEEAVVELTSEKLDKWVGVVDLNKGLDQVVALLFSDERTRILRLLKAESVVTCITNPNMVCSQCNECGRIVLSSDESSVFDTIDELEEAAAQCVSTPNTKTIRRLSR